MEFGADQVQQQLERQNKKDQQRNNQKPKE
jgi:hypothetical protein